MNSDIYNYGNRDIYMLLLCDVSVIYMGYITRFNGELIVKKISGFLGFLGCFLQVNSEN